jgi:hypothetical protein
MGVVQVVGWQIDVLLHAAVDVDTEHLEGATAVGEATLAGAAVAAFEVGAYRYTITDSNGADTVTTGYNFDGEFVTEDPWVCKKRLFAGIGVQIGAANTDAPHACLHESWGWCGWSFDIAEPQVGHIVEDELTHRDIS